MHEAGESFFDQKYNVLWGSKAFFRIYGSAHNGRLLTLHLLWQFSIPHLSHTLQTFL